MQDLQLAISAVQQTGSGQPAKPGLAAQNASSVTPRLQASQTAIIAWQHITGSGQPAKPGLAAQNASSVIPRRQASQFAFSVRQQPFGSLPGRPGRPGRSRTMTARERLSDLPISSVKILASRSSLHMSITNTMSFVMGAVSPRMHALVAEFQTQRSPAFRASSERQEAHPV